MTFLRRSPSDGHRLRAGHFAPCRRCGEIVVHADSTNEPFHSHARSKKCRELAAKRRADEPCVAKKPLGNLIDSRTGKPPVVFCTCADCESTRGALG